MGTRTVAWACVCLAWVSMVVGFVATVDAPAAAHAPHDQVTDIAFSADFETSGRVLAIVRGRLMRSDDRGMSWHEIVRGLGGETQKLRAIAISPADPEVVYATSMGGDFLRSEDGGWSWEQRPAALGVEASSLAVAPDDPDIVFTFGRNTSILARSEDGGQTWARPLFDDAEISVSTIAVLPDGRMLLGDHTSQILVSADAGATWTAQGSVDGRQGFRSLVVSTDDPATAVVFAATNDRRLFRSDDEGVTFAEVGDGLPDEQVMGATVSADFSNDATIWVSTRFSGAYRSDDGGNTFESVFDGLSRSPQADDFDSPHFTTIAAAPGDSGVVLLAGFDGLFLLLQGSDTWVPVETLTGYIAGLDVSPAFADDQTIAVLTYVRGAFISRDGGDSWEFANDGLVVDEIDEGNRFAPLRRLHNVHFSPDYAEDGTIWGATWVRVIRSTDGGGSWEQIPVGDPPEGSPLRQFVLAPSTDYEADHGLYAGTRQGEFFRSDAGGEKDSWELLSTFDTRVRSIVPSPSLADDDTIFVGTVGGLHRSTDGGITWTDTGVRNEAEVTGREIDFGIQVAVSPNYAVDGLVYAATDSGLFRSTDSGVSFDEVESGPLTADQLIEAVAFSPTFAEDGLLLVSVRGLGLVRSTDGGVTFEAAAASLDEANLLIADYANPSSAPIQFSPTYAVDQTIYAFAQQALVRSTDGGVEWETIELPSVEEGLAALPPFDPAGDDSRLVTDDPDSGDSADDGSPDDPDGTAPNADADADADADDADDSDGGPVRLVVLIAALLAVGGLGFVVVRRSSGEPS